MKIAVIGIGRSGTNILYFLLQKILEDLFDGDVNYAYEPFMWDPEIFDKRFDKIVKEFNYMASLSIEGIYFHQKYPLFIQDPELIEDAGYIEKVFSGFAKSENLLLKFIRANGRIRLLEKCSKSCKFVFIIRNPVDVINSSIHSFSLFGEDYHRSDYEKFVRELESMGRVNPADVHAEGRVQREYLYWYHMNSFALQSISEFSEKFFAISYESFKKDNEYYIELLCDFLKIPFKKKYVDYAKRKVGKLSRKNNLTVGEYEFLVQKLGEYKSLLDRHKIRYSFDPGEIKASYRGKLPKWRMPDPCYGATPIFIRDFFRNKSNIGRFLEILSYARNRFLRS